MTYSGAHNIALANRPLPSTHQCDCAMDSRHNLGSIKPSYDTSERYQSFNDSGKEIPVVIQKHYNNYYVLENKDGYYNDIEENVYNDIWGESSNKGEFPISSNLKKGNNSPKKTEMNYVTQFDVGSLSIVGLYILYRVMQKVR